MVYSRVLLHFRWLSQGCCYIVQTSRSSVVNKRYQSISTELFLPHFPLGETKSDWWFPFSQLTIDHNWPLLRLPQSYFAFRLMVWKKHFQTFEALENPSVLPPTIPCGLEHRLPSIECWVLFCDLVFVSQLFDNVWYMMCIYIVDILACKVYKWGVYIYMYSIVL